MNIFKRRRPDEDGRGRKAKREDSLSLEHNSEKRKHVTLTLGEFAENCKLEIKNGEPEDKMTVFSVNISRPGLLLADNDEFFVEERIQMLGNAELHYLDSVDREKKGKAIVHLMEKDVPCIILTGNIAPPPEILSYAAKYGRPVFFTTAPLHEVMNDVIMYLNDILAESETIHGELLDIDGEGVLIIGESRLGKSETALELIDRGHRLVADDLVIIRRVKKGVVGEAPDIIKHLIEVRGVGIVDVRHLFGVGAFTDEHEIDLMIEMERWNDDTVYERLGNKVRYKSLLGVNIPYLKLPVMPGRNMAIIVEVATANMRINKMGYNAMTEMDERSQQ